MRGNLKWILESYVDRFMDLLNYEYCVMPINYYEL